MKNKLLWRTTAAGGAPDSDVAEFTVGNDYLCDSRLVQYDCRASIAHAKLLLKMGIITKKEHAKLVSALKKIILLHKQGKFAVKRGDEDVHTKIENFLVKGLGKTGRKIHTFRSRNDQVLVALRLYCRANLIEAKASIAGLSSALSSLAKKTKGVKMPGYTHMQRAMPSSVQLWAGSFMESLSQDLLAIDFALRVNDENPLGSAAGYGLPFRIDKGVTTKELGFSRHFKNPLYVQNTRAKTELVSVFALLQAMMTLNKLASDLMLFTTKEFGFFSLPESMCTGSSIMPQKKNYDVLEIMRGNLGTVSGNFASILTNSANLPSGYNRDAQLNKAKLMESFDVTLSSLKMASKVVKNLKVNKENLESAASAELYAAEEAMKMAMKGTPFREAYMKVSGKFR
ncbi:MAG: argininosuccinate lyase [Candidatus Diapherotrites archaeon]|uniref:Argininosuccinate lyase n=1 Tax=Candidatus Iainarchaeum sp. TaxID=3101447 RepID=A0A8T3YN21_9ARCH|nr:argininosuccinate lyase [Candidatus Diapherotrites archaeon]